MSRDIDAQLLSSEKNAVPLKGNIEKGYVYVMTSVCLRSNFKEVGSIKPRTLPVYQIYCPLYNYHLV